MKTELTTEQSAHLIELGVSDEKASLCEQAFDDGYRKNPIFTLTAEEVDIVKYHFAHKQKALDSLLRNMEFDDERDTDDYIRWKCQYKEISDILTRIKQWQAKIK